MPSSTPVSASTSYADADTDRFSGYAETDCSDKLNVDINVDVNVDVDIDEEAEAQADIDI